MDPMMGSSALVITASISSTSARELQSTHSNNKVHKQKSPRHLVRTRRSDDVHQGRTRRPARFPVRIRAYRLSTPREGRDESLVSFDLADTPSRFELPNAYRVIVGRGEKVFAIWVENEGSDPVIVTDLYVIYIKANHRTTK